MARALLLASFALPLILLASACDEPTVPDSGIALRCPAAEELPLQTLGPAKGGVHVGPCGQLVYEDDLDRVWLVALDGSPTMLGYGGYHWISFAPSGDLLAWSPGPTGGMRLRSLLNGVERELIESGPFVDFGFVPSFVAPERGAWLWTCKEGVLERHDLASSEVVAEAVLCDSVVGSGGSSRLAYADEDRGVWLADLDLDLHIASDDVDFNPLDGADRDDSLWLDWDGQLLVHRAVELRWEDGSPIESPVSLWARGIDQGGAIVFDHPGALDLRQAPRRGAPVFGFADGQLLRFDAGVRTSVEPALGRWELTKSGQLLFANESGLVRIAERSLADELTTIGHFDKLFELMPSPRGDAAVIEHLSDVCILDAQGECDGYLRALSLWTKSAGLAPRVLYSTRVWDLLATLDDGRVLVFGAPVEVEGSAYDGEPPPSRVLLLAADGEIEAEWPVTTAWVGGQVFTLGPDRVLFEREDALGNGSLEVVGPAGHSTLVDLDVELWRTWVDQRGQRVAFMSRDAGVRTLYYGSLPQG